MDPTPPPPDESARPASDSDAQAEELAMAEDRAADDGWADEGAPSAIDPELTPEAPPSSEAASSGSGTEAWRGPESAGRQPASIEPPPAVEAGPTDDSGANDAPAGSAGGTSDWRGPEAAGRTPASIEPAPSAESVPLIEPAASAEKHAAEPTQEWPAADLRVPPSDNADLSEESELIDREPARAGRAPIGFSFFNRAASDDDVDDDGEAAADYAPPAHLRVEERPRRLPGRRAASAALVRADPAEICPFLVAAAGGWRLAVPSREHRCGAVSPPSPLSPQKQTRLCLTEGHLRCATFLAAGAARESRVGSAAMPERVSRWALARTTPVVEEVGGVRTTLAGMLADRRRWPAIPAMLLVVALATLGLSSLRGGGGPATALASPSPQPTEAAVPTVSIAPTPTVEPTPEPSATAAPTVAPSVAPTPAPTHATYTVVSGDTLGAIARQFGTTVQALMDLNGITDPGKLKIGQVLQIP